MATIEERVAAGAAFLDNVRLGWARHVNPNSLDMSCTTQCVLGQLTGSYSLGLHSFGIGAAPNDVISLGLQSDSPAAWKRYDTAWRREIEKRRREYNQYVDEILEIDRNDGIDED